MSRTHAELRTIREHVAIVGRLSDGLVRLGPFRLGLDGVLAWLPGVGELYSTVAGAFIIVQGVRAGVSLPTLIGAGLLLALRTGATAVPLAGDVFAGLFIAHRWAAVMVIRAIDQKLAQPEDLGDVHAARPVRRPLALTTRRPA